jgi:hypothetical protein
MTYKEIFSPWQRSAIRSDPQTYVAKLLVLLARLQKDC